MGQQTKFGLITDFGSFTPLLTTLNTYVDVGIWGVRNLKSRQFRFSAAGNNLLVAVLGSMDGGATYDITLENDISVTTATPVYKSYYPSASVPYCTHIKIQVKPATGGVHGTITAKYAGASI